MFYAHHQLDQKMLEYLDYDNGVFVEAGANDGISQSNTCFYEREKNWTGLLVEPNVSKFNQCKINRPKSYVENYALVSKNYNGNTIQGDFSDTNYNSLVASVTDIGDWDNIYLRSRRNYIVDNNVNLATVETITLTKLLDKHGITNIDFFSLDVEGYEISVLNGLDFYRFRPKYILIETANFVEIQDKMKKYMTDKNYKFVKALSGNDDLFVDSLILN